MPPMVLEPTSTFAPVVEAAAKKIVSELQDMEVSSSVGVGTVSKARAAALNTNSRQDCIPCLACKSILLSQCQYITRS
jgi:hypothetical protein